VTAVTGVIRYPAYKRITAALMLLCFGLWIAYLLVWPHNQSKAPGTGIAVGTPAPDFELKTIDGKAVKLSDYKGKPVMINFFATWCPPCRAEMPALQEAYKEYADKGFVILAVNMGETDVAIRTFQEKLGLTFPIVVDENDRVSKLYDIVPLPTSYFVDKNGVVQGRWTGEIRKEQLKSVLGKIL
jgi:cytochrome c biogenesis protein CcmG, thiol:disulfide interchange protein DsbE